MNSTSLIQLIRESINEYIREIDEAGNIAALEAKMNKTQEAIDLREKKMNMDGIDEAYHDMIDKGKMKELSSEVKALKKSLTKYEKQLDKLKNKGEKIAKAEEEEEKEIVDEMSVDGALDETAKDPESGPQLEEETNEEMGIYEMLYMQKLAGIISEKEYNEKIEEAKKKPSAGLTKKEKSAISKKAHAGKDIGKKGKGFEKVAKAAGGGEKGEKIAAAAMWKSEAKKAKSLKEEVLALFENEMLNEDNLVLSNYAKQLYSLFKKAGATPLIIVGKNSTSPDVKNSNVSILVTNSGELMIGIKGDKATAEKYSSLVAKQFPDLQLKGDIKIGQGWGGEKDSYADLVLVPKTTKKGGVVNEIETSDVKVGSMYVYEHPKAGPVKVKALGKSSYGDEYFTVEALESKGDVDKGKQFNAELAKLSPMPGA